MSGEKEREQAIAAACLVLATTKSMGEGVAALLDAGWVPPKQHEAELAAIASWQRDARRAFEAVEAIANDCDGPDETGAVIAQELRDALGERFLTPGPCS